MTAPTATYRLQFRDGMTFGEAAGLGDYLARLGVSHLYASPIFAAAPDSTHGYDGIDFAAMEPAIGGEDGFDALSEALADADLGLLLDFVPNHMAASERNPWWQSVLEWGTESPFAAFFDIDWTAPRLLLPVLGVPYGEALRDGLFGIGFDAASGTFALTCYDRPFPLTPPSCSRLLERVADPDVSGLAARFAVASFQEAESLKRRLAESAADPRRARAIAKAVAAARDDRALLHEIHEAQVWRLAHWRLAREALTYRRFFEIAELICLRVEDPPVFDAVHARVFELMAAGRIAGLRIDHVDGLADPKAYLERVQQRAPEERKPCYLLVEKILEPDERLPPDWPVAGTTGYEFIAAVAGLFVDRRTEGAMSDAWHTFTGTAAGYPAAVRAAKKEILEYNLAGELIGLTERACGIAEADVPTRDFGADTLRRAIVELACALPVYRTYVGPDGSSPTDRAVMGDAIEMVKRWRSVEDKAALDFIARLVLFEVESGAQRDAARAFSVRFQQTTGPVMAKAVEDTLFYRYNRLIALNEVGGAPDRYGAPVSAFHAAMAERRESQPAGLSATATHDTKRGEDARARVYALSEMPETWREAVARWRDLNAPYRTGLDDGTAPDPVTEWLFYQALVGAWPMELIAEEQLDRENGSLSSLRDRMLAYMEKAVREAKMRTSWTNTNPAYETAVADFVNHVLARENGRTFLPDFVRTCRPVWLAGAVNGLAQLAIKLAAPGVPDIYQGAELWDFSLVDPDNRRPVDFAARRRLLAACPDAGARAQLDDWYSGAPKMALTAAGLRLRADRPALFAEGTYTELEVSGPCSGNLVAFARRLEEEFAVLIAPRLVLELIRDTDRPLVPAARWRDTAVVLPDGIRGRPMRELVTGTMHGAGDRLHTSSVLSDFPVALLVDADEGLPI